MATVEESINLLAQEVTTMTADVSTLQSELVGSGAQFAEPTARLVTTDPRIGRIVFSFGRHSHFRLESASFGCKEHRCNKQLLEFQVHGGE